MSENNQNQPEIITEENQRQTQQNNPNKSQLNNRSEKKTQHHKSQIQKIRQKHPECIPVFFIKHQDAPKDFPSPSSPFILFNKQLKIEQAMYNLYNQIKIKGLYFFCLKFNEKDKKLKYVILKPEQQTIQTIYNKYGFDGYLTLIYADKNVGMGGINKLEKWLVILLVILVIVWVLLFSYPYFLIFQHGGMQAVINSISSNWRNQSNSTKLLENDNDLQNNNITIQNIASTSQKVEYDMQNAWKNNKINEQQQKIL